MLNDILENLPLFLSAFFFIYFIITILSKKYVYNILDPASITNIMISISLTDIFFLYRQEQVILEELLKVFCLTFAFYAGIYILSLFFKRKAMARSIQELANNFSTRDLRLIYFSAVVAILLYAYFSIQMLSVSIADERILLAKNNRILDVLKNGFSTYFLVSSFLYLALTKKKSYIPLALVVYGLLGFLSGSKSFLTSFVFLYAFFYGIKMSCSETVSQSRIKQFLASVTGIILIIVSAFCVLLFWRGDADIAYYTLLSRILNAGDIYNYSYVFGDYQNLYGKYDFFGYIFHPFLKMIGLQGYEYPLGAELYGLMGRDVEGYGPNPHLPILLLTLTQGNFPVALMVSLLFGGVYGSLSLAINKVMAYKNVNNTFKLFVLCQYLAALPLFYLDIGMFEQAVISLTITLLPMLFVRKIL